MFITLWTSMGNVYFLDSLTRIHQYQLKLIWQQSIREMTVTQGQVPCSNNQVSILCVRVRACVRACVCVCLEKGNLPVSWN